MEYAPLTIQLNFSSVNIDQNFDDFHTNAIKVINKFCVANVLTLLELGLLAGLRVEQTCFYFPTIPKMHWDLLYEESKILNKIGQFFFSALAEQSIVKGSQIEFR